MKRWMKSALALGLLAGAASPAYAECAGHKVTADAGSSTPIVTADTVAQPTDKKG